MKFQALRTYSDDGQRVSRMVEQTLDGPRSGRGGDQGRSTPPSTTRTRAPSAAPATWSSAFRACRASKCPGTVVTSTAAGVSRRRLGHRAGRAGVRHPARRRLRASTCACRRPGSRRIPEGFDEYDVVALGIGAYTSALAVEELVRRGVTPGQGARSSVTGATGGVLRRSRSTCWPASATRWSAARGKADADRLPPDARRIRGARPRRPSPPAASRSRTNAGPALSTRSAASRSTSCCGR